MGMFDLDEEPHSESYRVGRDGCLDQKLKLF